MATNLSDNKRPGSIRSKQEVSGSRLARRDVPVTEAAGRYWALLKVLPDLVFVQDRMGIYVDFWAHDEAKLALPAREILGKNFRDVPFSKEDLAHVRAAFRRALRSGRAETVEYGMETVSGFGYYEAHIVRLDPDQVISVVRDITIRRENEEHLRRASDNLELEKQALREKNIALEQVLSHLEQRAKEYQARVTQELEREIRPTLKNLSRQLPDALRGEVTRLEERIATILARDIDVEGNRYSALSQRELEVCERLREGLTSKQIADRLNVSAATVHKHREQIRSKLGFRGKRVNLAAYLRLHPPRD